jgi:hypothetical protein
MNFKSLHEFTGNGYPYNVILKYVNKHYYFFCHGQDSIDFDFSSSNSYAVSGQNGLHRYMAKYDTAFNLVWVKRLPTISQGGPITSAQVSETGSIYITGDFSGSIDLNPGTATHVITKTHTRGKDIFFAKYNANGNFVYGKHIRGNYDSRSGLPYIHVNADSTVYVSCNVENGFDLDPGTGTVNVTRKQGFFAKYDTAGNYVSKLNSTGNYYVSGSVTDSLGDSYFTGTVIGGCYFNQGVASTRVYTNGLTYGKDMFLLKLNAQGGISWVRESSSGGASVYLRGRQLAIDKVNKHLYLIGDVGGSFRLFAPNDSLRLDTKFRSTYRDAVFVGSYDLNGNLRYAMNTVTDTTTGSAYSYGIEVLSKDNFVVRGAFQFRHDFDPSPLRKTTLTSWQNRVSSTFLAIYGPNKAPLLSATKDTALCAVNDTLKIPFTLTDDIDTNAAVAWTSNDTLLPSTSLSVLGSGSMRTLCVPISDSLEGKFTIAGIVFDADSLSDTSSFAITLSIPSIDSMTITNPLCFGDSTGALQVFGKGVGTLNYSLDSSSFVTNNLFSRLPAFKTSVWLKDSLGCLAKDSATLTNPDSLYFTGATTQQPICNGQANGIITLHAKGGVGVRAFAISSLPYQVDSVFKNRRASTYYFVVKDSNSCTDSLTVVLNQADRVVIDSTKITHVDCYAKATGKIEVFAKGGTGRLTYRTNNDPKQFNNVLSGLRANTQYNIHVEDSNGCYAFIPNIRLRQPQNLFLTATVTKTITCFGGSDGEVTASARGGNGFYSYSIDGTNYTKNTSFTGLPATGAKLYVKDTLGCVSIRSLSIKQPSRITANLNKVKDISCYGETNGEAKASATGGNGGFLFAFNGGRYGSQTSFSGLAKGTYTLKVRDNKQCSATAGSITINEPDSISLSTSVIDEKQGNDGEITLTALGGTAPFTYSNDGTNYGVSSIFTGLTKGSYTLYAKDNNSCLDSISAEVNSTVGMAELGETNVSFGPNPTTGVVKIDLGFKYQNARVTMRNLAGQVVYERTYKWAQQIQMNVQAPAGVYLVEVIVDSNLIIKERLVKR